ncbi:hypothetical protein LDC_3129, partial [sediment metagenome]
MDDIKFPLPGDLNAQWTAQDVMDFLGKRRAEDTHFECKAFLHFDWELKCIADKIGDKTKAQKPFHSAKPVNSFMAYKVIQAIMGFANAEGGLILLGVAEQKRADGLPAYEEGIPVKSATGDFDFLITGIEPDGIGKVDGRLDEDKFKRELQDILFPKGKGWQSYIHLKENKLKDKKSVDTRDPEKLFKEETLLVDFPPEYKTELVKSIKLIPFQTDDGRTLTVAALVIIPSTNLLEIFVNWQEKQVLKIYLRMAFNNNGPLEGSRAREYIHERLAKANNSVLIENLNKLMTKIENLEAARAESPAVAPASSPQDRVPLFLQDALAHYVVPDVDGQDIPSAIHKAIERGENIFIKGESGMGKSLLMAHCYLTTDRLISSCFYAIDRTQGPNVFKTASILGALREQIQSMEGMPAVAEPLRGESKALWVWELEYLQNVLRVWEEKQQGKRIVVFLDGLDENDEAIESEFILNVLKDLIRYKRYPITWLLSSQPRKGMEWINECFQVMVLEGLNFSQGKELLKKHLPSEIAARFKAVVDELVVRARLENGLYDPEILIMMGESIGEKFSGTDTNLSFINKKVLQAFVADLPLTPRDKYPKLFERYTDAIKLKEIPSLMESAAEWKNSITSVTYTVFLYEILAVLASVRRPIPIEILQWALELEDPKPKQDFRGRKLYAYNAYPAEILKSGGLLQMALKDLQRFIKILDNKDGGCSFCKEAVRHAFLKYSAPEQLESARARLAGLAMEDLRLTTELNLKDRPGYLLLELFYLLSLKQDIVADGVNRLLEFDFFPEWLQERAESDQGKDWVASLFNDIATLNKASLSPHAGKRMFLVKDLLRDWKFHLAGEKYFVADFLRQAKKTMGIWPQKSNDSTLISPIGGYDRKATGHQDSILCLAVLPDGRLASGSADTT